MKSIIILIPESANLGSIDNSRRAFLSANHYLEQSGKPPLFKIQLCSDKKEIACAGGNFLVHPEKMLSDIRQADLIIVPAFDGHPDDVVARNKEMIQWLVRMHTKGTEIASLCVGAFLLASTGLLDGKNCSTHWRVAQLFKEKFPQINLSPERIITDEQGIYTSGGAFSSANLILYLISKFSGRQAAIYCSKIFQIDMDRDSQSPFIIFEGQKGHHDKEVMRAQTFIEENYNKKITVAQLALMLSLSRRSLERRFKKATANTLIEYIQRVKIEAAKKHFEETRLNISEVMYEVGYSDNKAFRSVFRNITGLTPIEYRHRYNSASARA